MEINSDMEESKELSILASTNVMERIAIDTIGPAMLDWISQFGVSPKNPKHDDSYIIRSIPIYDVIRRHGKP